jgi:glycosyltransferase involved in cell wall biosynthesis
MLVWLAQLARLGFDRLLPDAELFHATEHLLLPLRSVPAVLTVHDLIFRHLPQHHKPLNRWYLNLALPLYCRRAAQIIAVSEHTRRDLLAAPTASLQRRSPWCMRPPTPASSLSRRGSVAAVRARYGLPERYLLAVGTIEPRKNLTRLLAAFEVLHDEGLSDALVVVGPARLAHRRLLRRPGTLASARAVLLPGYLADDDLPAVYAGAQLLALP